MLTVLILYVCVNVFVQQPVIAQKKAEIQDVKERYEQAKAENEKLKKELDKSGTNDYIEKKARELGLLKKGEKVFIDVDN